MGNGDFAWRSLRVQDWGRNCYFLLRVCNCFAVPKTLPDLEAGYWITKIRFGEIFPSERCGDFLLPFQGSDSLKLKYWLFQSAVFSVFTFMLMGLFKAFVCRQFSEIYNTLLKIYSAFSHNKEIIFWETVYLPPSPDVSKPFVSFELMGIQGHLEAKGFRYCILLTTLLFEIGKFVYQVWCTVILLSMWSNKIHWPRLSL